MDRSGLRNRGGSERDELLPGDERKRNRSTTTPTMSWAAFACSIFATLLAVAALITVVVHISNVAAADAAATTTTTAAATTTTIAATTVAPTASPTAAPTPPPTATPTPSPTATPTAAPPTASTSVPPPPSAFTSHTTMPLRSQDVLKPHQIPPGATHVCDHIFVGSGPGGAPAAAHLARRYPALKICLFEQGRDEINQPGATCAIDPLTGAINTSVPCRDWAQGVKSLLGGQVVDGCMLARFEEQTSDQQRENRVPTNGVRGIQLGGTSNVNVQIYLRGSKKGTWDQMQARTGSAEWSFASAIATDNAITNRRQRIVHDIPSPLLTPALGGQVGGAPIFTTSVPAGTHRYLDPALFSSGANEIPILTTPRPDAFGQAVTRAAMAALPGRFANEAFSYSSGATTAAPWLSVEDPAYDEIISTPTFSMVDSSKAFWRLLFGTTGIDFLEDSLPNAVEFFKFAASTPSPVETLYNYVRYFLNVTTMPELVKQIGVVPFMTMSSTNTYTNAAAPFAPLTSTGTLFPFLAGTRTPAQAAFLYSLMGKGAAPAPPASNLVVIENALVTRVLFDSDVRANGSPTRVVGIEYIENGREATVPLGFGGAECNDATHAAARAAARGATPRRAFARYDTVLSAGAYVTPTLLQRSGIGAREDLEPIGINVRNELPGVGRMLNHPDMQVFFESSAVPSTTSAFSALQDDQALTMVRLRSTLSQPYADVHALFSGVLSANIESDRLLMSAIRQGTPIISPITNDLRQNPSTLRAEEFNKNIKAVTMEKMVARSVGHVRLRSADPTAAPHIAANLLGDDEDVREFVAALKQVVAIVEALGDDTTVIEEHCFDISTNLTAVCEASNSFHWPLNVSYPRPANDAPHFVRWVYPPRSALFTNLTSPKDGFAPITRFDEAKATAFVRDAHFQGWHPTSTAKMGKATERLAVLDAHARVYNVRGLRVIDASMLPVSPDVNTQGPIYIASTIAAQLMCEELVAEHGLVPTIGCRAPSAPETPFTPPVVPASAAAATLANLIAAAEAVTTGENALPWGQIGDVQFASRG